MLQSSKTLRVHSIGAVAKKGTCEFCPVTDCNGPYDNSSNSYINPASFSFQSVDDVILLSKPGFLYAAIDIKSAYRFVPVHSPHRQLQGFRWSFANGVENFYIDNFLCFGLSNASSIFHRISNAIVRMMQRRNFVLVSYLDDFMIMAENKENVFLLRVL